MPHLIARRWETADPRRSFHCPSGKRVLVVGAGSSGLSAAYFPSRLGHAVEVREAGPLPGGMRFGILAYRLSREELMKEIARIEKQWADEIILNHKVEDVLSEQQADLGIHQS
jgi:NADPH-dependent glutamate synthase beta subunit-like oxidoreductase